MTDGVGTGVSTTAREHQSGRRPFDRRVWLVARVELRRSTRRVTEDPAALVALIALALAMATVAAGLTGVALAPDSLFERALAAAGLRVERLPLARATVAGLWTGLAGATVSRTASVTGRPDAPAGLLLALSPRRAALGVLGAEWLRAGAVLGPAVVTAAVAAARVDAAPTGVTVACAGVLLLTSALAAGYPAGLALKATVEAARRRGVGWVRLALVASTLLAGAGAVIAVGPSLGDPLAVAAALPPGELADLALAPALAGTAPAAGVAWAVATLVAGPTVAALLAGRLWLVDPPRTATLERPGGLGRVPAPPGSPAVRAVARVAWLRVARAPVKLVYTLYPAGGVVALWLDPAARAAIVPSLYVYLPLYAAWAGGAGLALNPLGDEGAGLAVVLGAVRGQSFVRGHLLAGALPGATVGATVAVLAPLGALPWAAALAGVVVACAFGALAAAVAVAVGTALPGFDSVRVAANTRIVVPSFAASVAYFAVLAVLSAPGTLALLAVADLPTPLPRSLPAVTVAVVVQVGIAGLAVRTATRSGARRFDRYTLD